MDLKTIGFGDFIALGMGKAWNTAGYVAIDLKYDRALMPADLFVGKTISVTGEIYRGVTGATVIDVTDLANIEVK